MGLVGEAFVSDLEFSSVVHTMVYFGRNGIGGLLRIWIVSMIRCLLLSVELFLIGLRLGDSRLVILFLLFLALFVFCN